MRFMPTKWIAGNWLIFLLFAGCAPTLRIQETADASLKDGLPANMGLAYGRIVVRGWSATVRSDYATSVEFRNRSTGQTFTHRLNNSGTFHWLLRAGGYEITDVWSGLERVSQEARGRGIHFHVHGGQVAYLGDLYVQLPSLYSKGSVDLFDDFPDATSYLRYRYPSLTLTETPAKRLFSTPQSGK